jgi:hypothetical protein
MFYDEIDKAINEIHNKVDKEVQDIVVKDMIDQLYDNDKYSVAEVVNRNIRTTQMVYDQTMLDANVHREQAQLLAKDDITNRVSGLIKLAKKADNISVDNEINLNESINRLNSHTKSLGEAQDHSEMQRILNFFSDEFKIIEKIINEAKAIPKESIEFFKSEADQLRKMLVTTIAPSVENIQTRPNINSGQDSDSQIMRKMQDPVENTDGLTRNQPMVDSKVTAENINVQVADDSLIPPPIPFVSPHNMAAFAPAVEHLPSFNMGAINDKKENKPAQLELVQAYIDRTLDIKNSANLIKKRGENEEKTLLNTISNCFDLIPPGKDNEQIMEAKKLLNEFNAADDKCSNAETLRDIIEELSEDNPETLSDAVDAIDRLCKINKRNGPSP